MRFNTIAADEFTENSIIVVVVPDLIYTLNVVTKSLSFIAGSGGGEYKEGRGRDASFNEILEIITSPIEAPKNLWIIEAKSACIRTLNRVLNESSEFAGKCGTRDQVDGYINTAIAGDITTMASNNENNVYIFDKTHHSIRLLRKEDNSWRIDTVHKLSSADGYTERVNLMAFEASFNLLYMFTFHRVWRYKPETDEIDQYIDDDGLISRDDVDVSNAKSILFFSKQLLLVNTGGKMVQALDLRARTTTIVCSNSDSAPHKCGTSSFYKMIMHPTEKSVLLAGYSTIDRLEYSGTLAYINLERGVGVIYPKVYHF